MPDFSLPWWLGPRKEPWEALVAGVNAGSGIASNMLRGRQIQASMEQAVMEDDLQVKRLDATIENNRLLNASERQKIQIDRDALEFKLKTQTFQKEGMMRVGTYVAESIKSGKLLDPERQAGYWDLVGGLGPAVPPEMSNAIWDNTFGRAITSEERAKEIRLRGEHGDAPASVWEFNFREVLRKKYADEKDPTIKAERLDDLKAFELKAGFTKGDPLKIETLSAPDGVTYKVLRFGNGTGRVISDKVPQINILRLRADVDSIEERWKNFDPSFLSKDGKTMDAGKYKKEMDDAFNRAEQPAKAPEKQTGERSPAAFRFDPETRKLVPVE